MPALQTTSRVLSLATDPAQSRAAANVFVNEPTSGSLARSKGSLYVVTESEGDSPDERAYCRLLADSIRSEYYRDPTQELDQALSRGLDRGNAKMLKDERIPALEGRPVIALTCIVLRDGEMAIAQTLPVQTYIGTKTGIALVPDPPFWEAGDAEVTRAFFAGHAAQLSYHLYSATLAAGDIVTVCSSSLAQSLSNDRLEQWLTSGETRLLTQGMRTHYLRSDTDPAYALVIQAQLDGRERTGSPGPEDAKGRPAGRLPFAGAASMGGILARLGQGGGAATSARAPAKGSQAATRAGGTPPGRTNGAGRTAGAADPARRRRPTRPRGQANRQLAVVIVGALLVILLLLLLVKGFQHFQAGREHAAYLQASSQVDGLLTAAAQQKDPAAADTTLKQAQDLVRRDAAGLSAADSAALQTRVLQREDLLIKAGRLANVKLLANLSADPTAQLAQAVVQGSNIFILDTGGKRVLKVPAAGGPPLAAMSAGITVGTDTIQPLVAIAATSTGVLAVDSRNALWSFDAANNQIRRVPIPGADGWGEVRAITTYKNDLYVLDSKLSRIWRYTPQGDGYGAPTDYFPAIVASTATPAATATPQRGQPTATPAPTATPIPPPQLLHSVDLAVDGNVYVLQSDGSVLKYVNGLPQPFPETGLVGTMPSPSHIMAGAAAGSVYVVDPSGKRIVRFAAGGQFARQYLLPANAPAALTGIQSAALDTANGLIYLISDKAVAVATLPTQ